MATTSPSKDVCHVTGCGKPLYRSKTGRATLLCETHEKEYRKGTLRLRQQPTVTSSKADAPAPAKRGPGRPRKEATQAITA